MSGSKCSSFKWQPAGPDTAWQCMPPTLLGAVLRRVAEPVSEWQSQLELEHQRHWARKTGEHVVGAAAPRSGVAAGSAILQAALVSLDSGEGWRPTSRADPRANIRADAVPSILCLTGSHGSLLCCRRCYDLSLEAVPPDSPSHCQTCWSDPAGCSPLFPTAAPRVASRWRLSTSAAGPSWPRLAASHGRVVARYFCCGRRATSLLQGGRAGTCSPAPVPPRRHACRRSTIDPLPDWVTRVAALLSSLLRPVPGSCSSGLAATLSDLRAGSCGLFASPPRRGAQSGVSLAALYVGGRAQLATACRVIWTRCGPGPLLLLRAAGHIVAPGGTGGDVLPCSCAPALTRMPTLYRRSST
jgi:hypothetical protein